MLEVAGRHATGTGLYGRLPTGLRAEFGVLPHVDDAAALLYLTFFLRGKLRDHHRRRATVGPSVEYRLSLTLPNKQGMITIVDCVIVFHGERFLFISVSAPIADDARIREGRCPRRGTEGQDQARLPSELPAGGNAGNYDRRHHESRPMTDAAAAAGALARKPPQAFPRSPKPPPSTRPKPQDPLPAEARSRIKVARISHPRPTA